MVGGGWKYFIFFEAPQLHLKDPWHPILILGWIMKIEVTIALFTLNILVWYNVLVIL